MSVQNKPWHERGSSRCTKPSKITGMFSIPASSADMQRCLPFKLKVDVFFSVKNRHKFYTLSVGRSRFKHWVQDFRNPFLSWLTTWSLHIYNCHGNSQTSFCRVVISPISSWVGKYIPPFFRASWGGPRVGCYIIIWPLLQQIYTKGQLVAGCNERGREFLQLSWMSHWKWMDQWFVSTWLISPTCFLRVSYPYHPWDWYIYLDLP